MKKYENLTLNEVRDLVVDNDRLIQNTKDQIEALSRATKSKTFKTFKGEVFTRPIYSVDVDFNNEQKVIIFTHGKSNYNLWFLNKAKKLCLVTDAAVGRDGIWLTVVIDTKGNNTETKMNLDRFLHLYSVGDFSIPNKKFVEYYLRPYNESKTIRTQKEELEKQINSLEKQNKKLMELPVVQNSIEACL